MERKILLVLSIAMVVSSLILRHSFDLMVMDQQHKLWVAGYPTGDHIAERHAMAKVIAIFPAPRYSVQFAWQNLLADNSTKHLIVALTDDDSPVYTVDWDGTVTMADGWTKARAMRCVDVLMRANADSDGEPRTDACEK